MPVVHIGEQGTTPTSGTNTTLQDTALLAVGPAQAVTDIWEAIKPLPPSYDGQYALRIARAASTVKRPVTLEVLQLAQSSITILKTASIPSSTTAIPAPQPQAPGDFPEGGWTSFDMSPHYIANLCLTARNNVSAFILQVNSFVSRAKNSGFAPPSNPFLVIANLDSSVPHRPGLLVDDGLGADLMTNIDVYITLLDAESKGQIDLAKHIVAAVQISNMTMANFGGSGNIGVDLAQLIPDADAIKRQKANDALAAFDFKKRIPKMLFTANYNPQRLSKGCIVGWKKIPDASGYQITRTSIFDGSIKKYLLSNNEINTRMEHLVDFLRVWVLSFYDTFDERLVSCFLDSEIQKDQFYTYSVQAYQRALGATESLFNVPTVPVTLTVPQMNAMRAAMSLLQKTEFESEPDLISPYPIISKFLLGSTDHDWVLAGLNSRASVARKDDPTITRKFSYIGAQMTFLFQQASQGKLLLPAPGSLNMIASGINASIANTGVSPVIKDILDETGALLYFDGHDSTRDLNFKKLEIDKIDSVILNAVFSAIDVENATLNLKTLSNNMPELLTMASVGTANILGQSVQSNPAAKPTEIKVPANVNNISTIRSEDEIQFFKEFNENAVIDLVVFEGISKMMKAIRILSDISTNGRLTPSRTIETPIAVPAAVAKASLEKK